jgi:hypothetical protein
MPSTITTQHTEGSRSVLATLRSLVPQRQLTFGEALRVAELQANRLLELWRIDTGPVPSEIITELPRIRLVREYDLPVSGASHWSGTLWIISVNSNEPQTRQRFTTMHEFKHIVDHGATNRLYVGNHHQSSAEQAELVADYFAGCLLMPKRLFKSAWGLGIQTPTKLAQAFAVSPRAADVRLTQLGLVEELGRCGTPTRLQPRLPRPSYFRAAPTTPLPTLTRSAA